MRRIVLIFSMTLILASSVVADYPGDCPWCWPEPECGADGTACPE
jgi:hypothetical protein